MGRLLIPVGVARADHRRLRIAHPLCSLAVLRTAGAEGSKLPGSDSTHPSSTSPRACTCNPASLASLRCPPTHRLACGMYTLLLHLSLVVPEPSTTHSQAGPGYGLLFCSHWTPRPDRPSASHTCHSPPCASCFAVRATHHALSVTRHCWPAWVGMQPYRRAVRPLSREAGWLWLPVAARSSVCVLGAGKRKKKKSTEPTARDRLL